MSKFNLASIADKIKQTQPVANATDPPNKKSKPKATLETAATNKSGFLSKLSDIAHISKGDASSDADQKQNVSISETQQDMSDFENPTTESPKSLIDHLHLNGILPEIAIDEITKLLSVKDEIYLKDNVVEKIVNVLILEESQIVGTCLDTSIESNRNLTYIGIFSQRCDSNLRRFATKGTLFNVNHPMSFDYGKPNQQILLLANLETLNTLETHFQNAPSTLKPLQFKIGTMKIPSISESPMERYVAPQTDAIPIEDLKKHLIITSDQRLLDSDETLFDFDMLFS